MTVFRSRRRKRTFACVIALALATRAMATTITIGADQPIGPATQFFGHDAKGNVGLANTLAKARTLYQGTSANLLRIPMFAPAHFEDGSVDTTQYATLLTTIRNVKQVNPDVKIFASLKLDGAATFPQWVESTSLGSIFSNAVYKPRADKYSDLIVDYVQYMEAQGVKIDYFGAGNETENALTYDRYINTVRQVKSKLITQNVSPAYRAFGFVGGEAYGIPTSVNYLQDISDAGGMDTIDVGGSHAYPETPTHTKARWVEYAGVLGNKPMWHTELHMNASSTSNGDPPERNIFRMRSGMAIAFSTNIAGATGLSWWSSSDSTTALDKVLKRQIIESMVDARPLNTSPGYNEQATSETAPLYQAFRKGDQITLWVANPGTLDSLPLVTLLNTKINGGISSTYWTGPGNTITPGVNTGSLALTTASNLRSLSATSFPENSIAKIVFSVLPDSLNRWDVDSSGTWATALNWTTGVPSAIDESATLGSIITAPRVVTLATNVQLGTLTIDSSQAYTVSGTALLTFSTSSGPARLNIVRGDHVMNAPVSMSGSLTVDVAAAASINLNGSVTANSNTFTKTGAGTLRLGSPIVSLTGPVDLAGGIAVMNAIRVDRVTLAAGSILELTAKPSPHSAGTASRISTLSLAGGFTSPTAQFRISNNDLLLDFDTATPLTLAELRRSLQSGFAGGSWSGNGVVTDTTLASAPLYAVGYASGDQYLAVHGSRTFDNLSADSSSLVLRYTLLGDTNFDDLVNFNDLLVLAQNFGLAERTWTEGDFDYDGQCDFSDLLTIAQRYTSAASFDTDWALAQSLAPEPNGWILLSTALLSFRRGRSDSFPSPRTRNPAC